MESNLVKRLFVLGGIVIISIISIQSYWLLKTWDLKDQEFDQTVNIALRKVALRIAKFNKIDLPKQNLIQRKFSNYYAVNINSGIDANILEDYLLREMENHGIKTDFEYAVYDCFSQAMVYGNYCKLDHSDDKKIKKSSELLPAFNDLEYYFVVKFPSREAYLLSNMLTTVMFLMVTILAILFFMYTIWVILRQKRLSELQKDFINNMTHEFKTPISSIKIAADVLSNNPSIEANPRLSRYTSIIKDQNARLNDQVEKVLNIARIEKNSFELKKEPLDLRKTLTYIVDQESLRIQNGMIELIPEAADATILADRLHFTNVITNIIDNGIKYSGDAPHIQLRLERSQETVSISIRDNGIGISKENLKRIFDKFYRVNTGNVHDVKGFGLGLFYVKNICRAHGWEIDAESTEGLGTTIKIKIPL